MTKQNLPKHAELRAHLDAICAQFDVDKSKGLPPHRGGHRSQREDNRTRMERALSWLEHYEVCSANEPDKKFLFLWISFNAAYGADEHLKKSAKKFLKKSSKKSPGETALKEEPSDREKFGDFLHLIAERNQQIAKSTKDNLLLDLIRAHTDELRQIIESRFLLHDFWVAEYFSKRKDKWLKRKWEKKRKNETDRLNKALDNLCSDEGRIGTVLELAFGRIYTLRNQIVHGGASWRDKYNRSSLQICNSVLDPFLRAILKIMLDVIENDPYVLWGGKVAYPPFLLVPDDETKQDPPIRYG